GGNKNEVVITMSLDTNNKLQWVNIFSWSDVPTYEALVKNHIQTYVGKPLDMVKIVDYMSDNVNTFKRKEFKDFEYINSTTDISILSLIITGILITMVCGGFGFYIIYKR
ncbi:MAG: hypothetical protein ACRCTZ_18265, partial [Sarcina sp.]